MLQELRDKSTGLVAKIIIGLIVVVFAFWGTESLFKADAAAKKAITVNGDKITEQDIAIGINNRKQDLLARYGESVPPEELADEKLRGPVVEGLVQQSLLVQAARNGGLVANKAEVNKEIYSAPIFQKDGKFDPELFQQWLRQRGYSQLSLQKLLAESKMVNQLQATISNTAFVTPAEAKTVLGLLFQTRDFSYVIIPAEKAEKSITVEEADIKAYYDANPKAFTTPEQVAVDYIDLSTTELAKTINVTDEQIAKQFEQNSKSYVAKTERQAAHILLEGDAQKLAGEVAAKLAAGEDFAKLAKQYSTDAGSKDQGGDLGFSSGDTFPAEFEAALAKLKVGEVSVPVKTDAGTHIIKLLAERGGKPPTLEEARADIIEQIKRAEAENQFTTKLERLKDLAYNADSLVSVAKDIGLTAKNTGLFARTGGTDLTANPSIVNAAFSSEVLEQGNSSEVIELGGNRVVVLKKTDRKPEQLQPLDVVKDKIVALVKAQKTEALLAQQAKDFIDGLNAGKSITEQAQSLGLEVKTATKATRNDQNTDRSLLQYAFSLATPAAGKTTNGNVKTQKGDQAVISLSAVNLAGDDAIPAEQRTAITSQLASIGGTADMSMLQKHLEEVAKIKRN